MSQDAPSQLAKGFVWLVALVLGVLGVLCIRFGVGLWQNLAGIPLVILAIGLARWSVQQK
jgi:hypothetical protein